MTEAGQIDYLYASGKNLNRGNQRDFGIDAALYMARVIHSDFVFANASAWHWRLAISPYNYKDGLVYIDNNKFGGKHYESKILWALGHYFRFITPKMKRFSISGLDSKPESEAIKGVLQSVYKSKNEIVIVFVNQLKKSQNIKLSGIPEGFNNMEVYITSQKQNVNLNIMKSFKAGDVFKVAEESLMTCILKKNVANE